MPTPVPSLTDRFPLPKQALRVVTKALILFLLVKYLVRLGISPASARTRVYL